LYVVCIAQAGLIYFGYDCALRRKMREERGLLYPVDVIRQAGTLVLPMRGIEKSVILRVPLFIFPGKDAPVVPSWEGIEGVGSLARKENRGRVKHKT